MMIYRSSMTQKRVSFLTARESWTSNVTAHILLMFCVRYVMHEEAGSVVGYDVDEAVA